MNRRAFFSSAIAILSALFTRKTTTLGTAPLDSPTTLIVKGWAGPINPGQAYCYVDRGHLFYESLPAITPAAVRAFDLPQFHRHAFALTSEPVDVEQMGRAVADHTAAVQRYHAEDWARKVQDGRIRS